VAGHTLLKSGIGIPDINQKVEPCTGYLINLRPGATGKKDLAIYGTMLLKKS
jgi:hypothetical protein